MFVSKAEGYKVEMNCLSNRWSHQNSSPLVPSTVRSSVTKSGQRHPPLTESSEVNQAEISQTKASWDAKGHGYQLVLSPPNLNHLLQHN